MRRHMVLQTEASKHVCCVLLIISLSNCISAMFSVGVMFVGIYSAPPRNGSAQLFIAEHTLGPQTKMLHGTEDFLSAKG